METQERINTIVAGIRREAFDNLNELLKRHLCGGEDRFHIHYWDTSESYSDLYDCEVSEETMDSISDTIWNMWVQQVECMLEEDWYVALCDDDLHTLEIERRPFDYRKYKWPTLST